MKRFTFAVVISLVLHVLIIFTLTRAEISLPAPGSGPGVTRATFVHINTGSAGDSKAEEGNQEVEPAKKPAEKKAEKKITPPREPEKKAKTSEIPAEIAKPVKKPAPPEKPDSVEETEVKPEEKPLEKKKEPPVKKAAPKREKQEPEIDRTAERGEKDSPESEQDSEEQPGETAPAESSNRIHDLAEIDITRRVTPGYPRASRLRLEEGQVVIIAEVRGGKVSDLSVEKSSGHQRLDRAALEAVKKWEFGFTGARTVRIPVIFRLRD